MNNELTPRETEILQALADGREQKELGIDTSLQTIKNQLKAVREKLGADNTVHAVAIGIRRSLID